jgi:hypothetical protein
MGDNREFLSPKWFQEKAKEFRTLDDDADKFIIEFKKEFAPEKLKALSGKELLEKIFWNGSNKNSLCYKLEYDKIFGGIQSANKDKYKLFYNKENNSWAKGSSRKPTFLSDNEAIEFGTTIIDKLVAGAERIADVGDISSFDEYHRLYSDLHDITGKYIDGVFFKKYYTVLYPNLFPPIYSEEVQDKVLDKLNIISYGDWFLNCVQIRYFAYKRCNISNVMFNKIFWVCGDTDNKRGKDNAMISGDYKETKPTEKSVEITKNNRIHPLNFIVYGAPGTGKTYSMVEYALAIIDNISIEDFPKDNQDRKTNIIRYKELVNNGQIVFTTFHQNYGYEDFIQGLRPDTSSGTLSFKIVDGVFKKIADRALDDEDNDYVIIIDEINRANISKVFGELITLVEEDKRWGELNEMSVTLQSGDVFVVPNNLYIIGTMNSADKSISLIDTALRRRFEFIEKKPDASLVQNETLKKIFLAINENLVKELDSTDLLVGHSYFMNKTEKDLCKILNNNIIPLLYEYFYDNRKKVANLLKEVIDKSDANVEIIDAKMGRLSVKDKVE